MATNANKPAFDYAAHNQALAHFRKELEEHVWSFQTDSYHTLVESHNKEIEFFKTAMRLGIQGVDEFVYARDEAMRQITRAEFDRGVAWQKSIDQNSIDYLKKQLEETQNKYMTPLDFFKEKLERHDWYYSFSDDMSVYRRGAAAEEALLKEANELGPEFEKAFQDKRNAIVERIRNS
jgi:hypothetical protein